jgi:hypothetical protein
MRHLATITRNQYKMLAGLIHLAEHHMAQIASVERAACEIIGKHNRGAINEHILWNKEASVDELLEEMGITVE